MLIPNCPLPFTLVKVKKNLHKFVFAVSLFLLVNKFICVIFGDSAYK